MPVINLKNKNRLGQLYAQKKEYETSIERVDNEIDKILESLASPSPAVKPKKAKTISKVAFIGKRKSISELEAGVTSILRHKPATRNQIADKLHSTPARVKIVLDRMEKIGRVEQKVMPILVKDGFMRKFNAFVLPNHKNGVTNGATL